MTRLAASALAKITIPLTAAGAGVNLAVGSVLWVFHDTLSALPYTLLGVLLLGLGGGMVRAVKEAYLAAVGAETVAFVLAVGGMARWWGPEGPEWYVPALGASSVLALGVILFSLLYLRESDARLADGSAPAPARPPPPGGGNF